MAIGTRLSQHSEVVTQMKSDNAELKEAQNWQQTLLEELIQQVGNLANNYTTLSHTITSLPYNQPRTNHQNPESSQNPGGNRTHFNNLIFENQGGIHSRTMKLDFPKFDGSDPNGWVFRAQQFFNYHGTPDTQKIHLASFHMEGKALTWYQWLLASHPITTWPEFVQAIQVRFASTPFDDLVADFTKLRQVFTVEEYQTEFEVLSNRIPRLPEYVRISTFVSGLRDDIRIMVTMFRPTNLPTAFVLARLYEEEVWRKFKIKKIPASSSPIRLAKFCQNLTFLDSQHLIPLDY